MRSILFVFCYCCLNSLQAQTLNNFTLKDIGNAILVVTDGNGKLVYMNTDMETYGTPFFDSDFYKLTGRSRPIVEPFATQSVFPSQAISAPRPAVGIPTSCFAELKAEPPLTPGFIFAVVLRYSYDSERSMPEKSPLVNVIVEPPNPG